MLNRAQEKAVELLDEFGVARLRKESAVSLSGGERRRVELARALAASPDFILLDEPAANLDFVYEPWLLKKLHTLAHEKGIGILLSVHDINLAASYADTLILLPLLATPICGKISDILNKENLKLTYGMEFECQKVNYFQSLL